MSNAWFLLKKRQEELQGIHLTFFFVCVSAHVHGNMLDSKMQYGRKCCSLSSKKQRPCPASFQRLGLEGPSTT